MIVNSFLTAVEWETSDRETGLLSIINIMYKLCALLRLFSSLFLCILLLLLFVVVVHISCVLGGNKYIALFVHLIFLFSIIYMCLRNMF